VKKSWRHELQPHRATAVSVMRGWRRSEAMLEAFGVTTSHWRDATKIQLHFAISESAAFVGRAVAAKPASLRTYPAIKPLPDPVAA
jgi:hypothetical protein